jgi:hypothetical protein
MLVVLLLLFMAATGRAQTNVSGGGTGSGISTYTVAGLPGSPATNTVAVVSDGSGASCTVGGGSTRVLCQYNGSAWVAISGGGGVAGSNTQVQFNDSAAFGADPGLTYTKATSLLGVGSAGGTSGQVKINGTTSGSATLGVADAAGTPNKVLLPTTTGSGKGLLSTDGANPQQLSFVAGSPTVNGDYGCEYHITASAVVDLTCPQLGQGGRSIIAATTTDTVLYSDNLTVVTHDQAASGTVGVTLPTATTLGNPSFAYVYCNHSAQTDTITPTTWTIQEAISAAGASITVVPGTCYRIKVDPNSATNWLADSGGGGGTFPLKVGGTVNSGGIPYFSSTTQESSSALLTSNVLVKGGGAGGAPANSLHTDNGTTSTYTGTGGIKSPLFTTTGTSAGYFQCTQGSANGHGTANTITEECPTAVTAYEVAKPAVSATGIITNNVAAAVITQGISGDSNHSATVTIGSGTSIGSTQLCSSAKCPAGTYVVHVYVDITTACGTSGTYVVNLIYTDDQGAKTAVVNLNGTGSVPATGTLTTTSTANYGENAQVLRLTSGNLNYSTTAGACGTAGPMVGTLYMAAVPVM